MARTRKQGPPEHTGDTPVQTEKKVRKRTRLEPASKHTPDAPLPSVEDEDMTSAPAQVAGATSTMSRSESIHQDDSRSTSPQHIDTQPSSSSPSAHAHPSQQTSAQLTVRPQTSEQEPHRYPTRHRSVTRSVSPSMTTATHNTRGTKRQREQSADTTDADVGSSQPAPKRTRASTKEPATRGRGGARGRGRGRGGGGGGRANGTGKLQRIAEASPIKVQTSSDNEIAMADTELLPNTSLIQPVLEGSVANTQTPSDNEPVITPAELHSSAPVIQPVVEGNAPKTPVRSNRDHDISPFAAQVLDTIRNGRPSKIEPVVDNGYESLDESEVPNLKQAEWRKMKKSVRTRSGRSRKYADQSTMTILSTSLILPAFSDNPAAEVSDPAKLQLLAELNHLADESPNGWEYLAQVAQQMRAGGLAPTSSDEDELMNDHDTTGNAQSGSASTAHNDPPQTPTRVSKAPQSQSWFSSAKKAITLPVTLPMKFFGGSKGAGKSAATNAQNTDFTFSSSSTIAIPPTGSSNAGSSNAGSSKTGSSNSGSSSTGSSSTSTTNAGFSNTGSATTIPATITSLNTTSTTNTSTSNTSSFGPPSTPTQETGNPSLNKSKRKVQFADEPRLQTRQDRHDQLRFEKFGTPIPPRRETSIQRQASPESYEIPEEHREEFQEFLNQKRAKSHGEREEFVFANGPTLSFEAPDPNASSDDESDSETTSAQPEWTPLVREAVVMPPYPVRDVNDDTYFFTFKNKRWSHLMYAEPVNKKIGKDPLFNSGRRDMLKGQWAPDMVEWWVETEKWEDLLRAFMVYKQEEKKFGSATYDVHEDMVNKINKFNDMIKKAEDARLARAEANRAAPGNSFAAGRVNVFSGSAKETDRRARVEDSPEEEEESVLQPKANAQTPPPPPRPSNAQLPTTVNEAVTPAKPKPVFDLHKPKTPSLLRYAERAYSSPIEQENVLEEEGDAIVVDLDDVNEGLYFGSGEEDVMISMDVGEVEWE